MIDIAVTDHTDDRPKNLVLGGGVLVVGHVEDGRLEVEPRPVGAFATGNHRRAGINRKLDVAFASRRLRCADHRPHRRGRVG